MSTRAPALLAAALIAAALPGPTAAQEMGYSGSLSYATGSYVFAERTHSFWLSSALTARSGVVSASLALPLVLQNSGVVSLVETGVLPTGGEGHGVVGGRTGDATIGTRRGGGRGGASSTPTDSVEFRDTYRLEVADPSLRFSAEAFSGFGLVRSFSLTMGVKAPLRGLESGVGTGRWDVGAGGSAALGRGRTWVFLDAAYWWFGDLPELELRDGPSWAVGVARLWGTTSVLATMSGSGRIVSTARAPLSASVGVSRFLPGGRSMSGGVTAGLSEASPDLSIYVGWSVGLGGS